MSEQLISAFSQVGVVLGIGFLIYGIIWLFFRRRLAGQSFFKFIGIWSARQQLDRKFWIIWLASVVFAVVSLVLEYRLSENFRQMLMSDSSPYGKILKNGFDFSAVIKALIYCFVQASAAEELLFRGLIAKRLFKVIGFLKGNFVQALIFWLMHLAIFWMVTGEWISLIQGAAFITSFGMGLILGYVNYRRDGESIIPSWLLHGTANFISFLTLAYVWSR